MLIAMAVHCTEVNGRHPYLTRTLDSLATRVNLSRHRLFLCDNASSRAVRQELDAFAHEFHATVYHFPENLGTARAINRAWECAEPGETVCKMDDDVEIWHDNWPDMLEDAFSREPSLGICGLKRKDLAECPWSEVPFYRSRIAMLPHEPGQRWLTVEYVQHVFGTCQAYSPRLRAKIGYLYQMQDLGNLYGFDDALASHRAHLAGFQTAFLLGIDIDHIDPGQGQYSQAKADNAGNWIAVYEQVRREYQAGTRPLYWEDRHA